MRRLSLLLIMTLILSGCVSYQVIQQGTTTGPDNSYTVELPVNWMRLKLGGDRIAVTRDGFGLQSIAISRAAGKNAFPKLKRIADEKLLISELAELQISELKSSGEQLSTLKVVENTPVSVGGKPGFKLHVQFKNQRGLNFDQILYGALHKDQFYLLSYMSPRLYYFEKYLPEFDRTVTSFRLS